LIKPTRLLAVAFLSTCTISIAHATDLRTYLIADALATPTATERLDPQIQLKFAHGAKDAALPKQAWRIVKRNRREETVRPQAATEGSLTDKEVCQVTFIQALQELQSKARNEGHTSVERIVSGWTSSQTASNTVFTCAVGAATIGIQLRAMPPAN
jgi:hypothetical protein